jgi:tripeptide aminopeptidase
MEIKNLNRLTEIFLDLISIDAISGREKPVADYITSFMNKRGINVIEDCAGQKSGGNSGNLIASVPGTGNHSLIAFMAHMDTIQSTAGVNPVVADDMIRSGGKTILGADNRAGIAIILYAIESLLGKSVISPPFEAIFTIGEETGLFGSKHLEVNKMKSSTVFILDSSASPGSYILMAPGAYEFEIGLIGKTSHAAVNPQDGVNALKMAGELIHRIQLGQIDGATTFNFGKIVGGEANNLVPSKVNLSGEIRSLNKDSFDHHFHHLEEVLRSIITKHNGSYNISKTEAFPGYQLSEDSATIKKLYHSMKELGVKPLPLKYKGGSDANILNNRGLIAVNLGIGAKKPHSFNEYIKISDMGIMTDLVCHLVKN